MESKAFFLLVLFSLSLRSSGNSIRGEPEGLLLFMPEAETQENGEADEGPTPEAVLDEWYGRNSKVLSLLSDAPEHNIVKRSLLPRIRPRRLFGSQGKRSFGSSSTFNEDSHESKKRALSIFMALPDIEETIPEAPSKLNSQTTRGPKLRPYGMPLRWG